MKKRVISLLLVMCLLISLLPVVALAAWAAEGDLPTTLKLEPSATNNIPAAIEVFARSSGGWYGGNTTYELYIPGNVDPAKCFFSWADGLKATLDGKQYDSGACPIPAPGETKTYTFTKGTTTKSFEVKTWQGSESVKPIFIEIDESKGTIAAMDNDSKHEASCSGIVFIDGQQFVLSKIKGRGNYTWSQARDKKAYNLSLDTKVSILGIDSPATKKWSILSEVADRSLLSNRSGFALAHQIGVGQDTASADVWMNGEYQGCYTVTPKYDSFVTKDGYLIEEDNYKEDSVESGGDPQFALDGLKGKEGQWGGGGSDYNLITVKKMGDNLLTVNGTLDESPANMTAAANKIKDWLQDAWDAIRSDTGYNSKGKYYTDYIDIESFAKTYLMQEYVKSFDVCAGSILFHRDGQTDAHKLIAGPTWDLDNAMGSTLSNMELGTVGDRRSGKGAFISEINEYKTSLYKTLGRHEDFMEEVYKQYNLNRAAFENLPNTMQAMADSIEASAMMNHAKVEYISYNNHNYGQDQTLEAGTEYEQKMKRTGDSRTNWPDYASNLKEYIKARSLWFKNVYTREDEGFVASINAGQGATVTVFDTQEDAVNNVNGKVGEKYAYARNSQTGEITKDGTGQVNFRIAMTAPYQLDAVTVEPTENFNNLKGPTETGVEGLYRVTKITGPITIKIATAENICAHEFNDEGVCTKCGMEAYKITIDCDEHCTVTVYDSQDLSGEGHPNAKTAFARAKTGEIDVSGSGQLNFIVNVEDGYAVDDIIAEPMKYGNLKNPTDASIPNSYRLTKIEGSFLLHVTTKKTGNPSSDYFADGDYDKGTWEILNPDAENYSVVTGEGIVMPTQRNDIYSTGAPWKNCFVTPTEGDWKAVTKAVYPEVPKENYQQAMMLVWGDEDNYIRINCQTSNLTIEPGKETNGSFSSNGFQKPRAQAAEDGTVTLYWMIEKSGTTYTLRYSQDGLNFTDLGSTTADYEAPKIGLFATANTDQGASNAIDVYFEYLAVLSHNGVEEVTPAEMLTWAAQNVADYIGAALPKTEVDKDLELPKAPHGYTVTVNCDHPEILDAAGKFTKPETDTQVKVSITVREGDAIGSTAEVKLLAKGKAAAVVPTATFVCDEHCSITAYDTQDLSGEGHPNAKTALARDKATGNPLPEGGQIWFVVKVDDGYEIDTLTAEPTESFGKLKTGVDETVPNSYNLTKVNADVTVTVTTKVKGGSSDPELDKTALEAAIQEAEAVKKDDYTDESVKALDEALAAAKKALDEAKTQEEIDAAANALNDAIKALEKKPVEVAAPKDDYFADGDMNESQWTILNEQKDRPDPDDAWSYYRFDQGTGLVMPTQHNSIYQTATPGAWKNMFTMPAEGDWDVVAKAFYPQRTTGNYQQVQVIAWQDEDNYVRINCQNNLRVEPFYENNGRAVNQNGHVSTATANADGSATFYFRIKRTGDTYVLSYSNDNCKTWKDGGTYTAPLKDVKFALFATQDYGPTQRNYQTPVELAFEYVAVLSANGETVRDEAGMLTWAAQNAADYMAASLPAKTAEKLTVKAPHGYTVEFVSDNEAVIAKDGTVTPAKEDTKVKVAVKVTEEGTTATSETVEILVPGTAPEEPVLDKTELEKAIQDAEAVKKDDYTEETVKALDEALEAAKKALADAKTQKELDDAAKALNDAIKALEKKPEEPGLKKDELEKAIEEAEKLDADKYTEESGKALAEAIAAAKKALEEAKTQAELDAAKKALDDAIAALVEKTEPTPIPTPTPHVCPGANFTDMPAEDYWSHAAIDWAIVNKITVGTSDTTFGPTEGCTRAQVVTFLWRAAKEPAPTSKENPFKDVKESDYFYNAVLWAVEKGITVGTDPVKFSPGETCTRAQIVTFLYRYEGKPEVKPDDSFTDVKADDYFADSVAWAVANGITVGTDPGKFSPYDTCTREQVVTFLYRDIAE